jgi:AbrB family looped-hinge helix DNA binding protein
MADVERLSVRLEKSGRILIPVAVRRRLGLKEGESDVLLEIGDSQPVVVTGRAQVLKKAQAVLSRYINPGTLVSEELIAERKKEARQEDQR